MCTTRGITAKPESRDALSVMVSLTESQQLCLHQVLKKCAPVTIGLVSSFFFPVPAQGFVGEDGYKSIDAADFGGTCF
jgi:hypothetical protein